MTDIFAWNTAWPLTLAALAFGYICGSIPFGLILTRMAGLGDVRAIGSGNIGATNVLRTGNKKLAALTLVMDMLKGSVPVWLVFAYAGEEPAIAAGFAAFIGHLYPVWLGFKGGKGIATYIGVLLALAPWIMLLFAVIWLVMAFMTRYSSLSALVATLVIPVALVFMDAEKIAAAMAVMTAISWWKHRANISRLLAGTESKIGKKG